MKLSPHDHYPTLDPKLAPLTSSNPYPLTPRSSKFPLPTGSVLVVVLLVALVFHTAYLSRQLSAARTLDHIAHARLLNASVADATHDLRVHAQILLNHSATTLEARALASARDVVDIAVQHALNETAVALSKDGADGTESETMPEVVIFRRTMKTASSSMLEPLMSYFEEAGYHTIYYRRQRANVLVRGEAMRAHPRRLWVAEHNDVTRDDAGGRRTLIIDTLVDGYRQITSYCRYILHVRSCGDEMVRCLKRPRALREQRYRWAGREGEDAATFIDMPLSSAHPALSNTVFRSVFPNGTLHVQQRNVRGSACAESAQLREVYNKEYKELERQIAELRFRMLTLAGYPAEATGETIALSDMMDRAEEMEARKYDFGDRRVTKSYTKSNQDRKLEAVWKRWKRSKDGKLEIVHAG